MFDMFRRPRLCLSLLRRPQNPIVGWSFSSSVGLTLSSSMFFSQSVLAITMKFTELMVFVGTPWREEERRIYSVSGLLKLHKRRCSYIAADVEAHSVDDRKERRKCSPTEDVVLIIAWLNTSKDPVVGNEQKAIAFWKRIAAYFGSSPKLAGLQRESYHTCYDAATKQKSSGQSEDDVLKMAHEIFFNDYMSKFTLEHAWLELRHDQKWCDASSAKGNLNSKRRKLDEQSAQSSTSVPLTYGDDEGSARPIGVKTAKGKGKMTFEEEGKARMEFQSIWEIKQKDFALKEKLNKQKLLDSLIAKTEPLDELEIALKNKLFNDMLYASLEMRDSYVWVKLALIQVEDSKKTWDRRRHLVVCISEDATYPSHMFRRRFRMNKLLFMRIVDRLSVKLPYFQQRRDATGRFGHSPLQ
ncbi:unnamed protein product, partial [Brassica oleracea var. botrytis]